MPRIPLLLALRRIEVQTPRPPPLLEALLLALPTAPGPRRATTGHGHTPTTSRPPGRAPTTRHRPTTSRQGTAGQRGRQQRPRPHAPHNTDRTSRSRPRRLHHRRRDTVPRTPPRIPRIDNRGRHITPHHPIGRHRLVHRPPHQAHTIKITQTHQLTTTTGPTRRASALRLPPRTRSQPINRPRPLQQRIHIQTTTNTSAHTTSARPTTTSPRPTTTSRTRTTR